MASDTSRVSSLLAALILLTPTQAYLTAQATGDQPRMTVGIAGGAVLGSQSFWKVPQQVVHAPAAPGTEVPLQDVFGLSRDLTGNITMGAQGVYYPRPYLGIGGEITYFGIGTEDSCTLVVSNGYEPNRRACESLNRSYRSTTVTSFMGDIVIRPYSRAVVQPYGRIGLGASAISDNLVSIAAFYGNTYAPIYPNSGGLSIRPTGMVGLGVMLNAGTGYLVRVEARRTWLALNHVTGPSPYEGMEPPTASSFKSFPSILIGFDVVLEKSRGRRY